MARVIFREERCKGCGLCTTVCPKGLLTMAEHINIMGFHPVAITDMDQCTGCATCARMCPDLVIEVAKEEKKVG